MKKWRMCHIGEPWFTGSRDLGELFCLPKSGSPNFGSPVYFIIIK